MATERLVPRSSSSGLEPVLVAVRLEDTLLCQCSEHLGDFLAEGGAVVREVLNEQVDEMVNRCPDADVTGWGGRQQADEVDEAEDSAA